MLLDLPAGDASVFSVCCTTIRTTTCLHNHQRTALIVWSEITNIQEVVKLTVDVMDGVRFEIRVQRG